MRALVPIIQILRKRKKDPQGSALPFLGKEAEKELVLRVVRARAPEDERYRQRKAEISADHYERGFQASTMHFGALREEEINHLRQLMCIKRDALFHIIEGNNIRLANVDVKPIADYLAKGIEQAALRAHHELINTALQMGLPIATLSSPHQVVEKIDEVIHLETVAEVTPRVQDLRRRQKLERREWWSKHVGKFWWAIVVAALTVISTVAATWLQKD